MLKDDQSDTENDPNDFDDDFGDDTTSNVADESEYDENEFIEEKEDRDEEKAF